MNNTYVIMETIDVIDVMIEQSTSNEDNVRKSLDGSKVILEFTTKYPSSMAGKEKKSHTEVLQFLENNKAEWIGES